MHVNKPSEPASTLGTVILAETNTVSTAVQAPEVTVNIYVPAASTVGDAVAAPERKFPLLVVQLKVAPAVEEDPFNDKEVTEQVSILSAPALTLGVEQLTNGA